MLPCPRTERWGRAEKEASIFRLWQRHKNAWRKIVKTISSLLSEYSYLDTVNNVNISNKEDG